MGAMTSWTLIICRCIQKVELKTSYKSQIVVTVDTVFRDDFEVQDSSEND